jgi:hypothetical protein
LQVEVQDLGVGVVQQAPKPIGGAVKARKVSIMHGRIVMAKDVRVLLGAVTQVPTMALTSRRWSGAAHVGACVDAVQLAPIEQGRTSIFQARADHLGRGMDPVKRQREGGVAASSQKLRAMARRPEAAAVRDRGNQHLFFVSRSVGVKDTCEEPLQVEVRGHATGRRELDLTG